jgi:hypothetical protein
VDVVEKISLQPPELKNFTVANQEGLLAEAAILG